MKGRAEMAENKSDSMEALIENLKRQIHLLQLELERTDYQMN